ncbi:MAG TPA: DUF434 domain-containing protein [Pseudomonadota bacterium]|nr:DUF434 domain-containing protein [Pseudomonadota bacterium]
MPHAQRHRGAHPEDARLFAAAVLPRLRAAAAEISYLSGRGYPLEPILNFVGGHHQLEARQRLALRRTAASPQQQKQRAARLVPPEQAAAGPLHIDGFNLIITLEVALSGGLLLRGADGAVRDLAGLSGSYRPVEETEEALRLLGRGLHALAVPAVELLLDAPVANSGRLRARVLEHAAAWSCAVSVSLLPDVDRALVAAPRVVSSDSAVLEACTSWLNLGAWLLARFVPEARLIDLAADPAEAAAQGPRDPTARP